MRIVIDMQGAQTESRFRGIGRYTMNFARALIQNRGDHEVVLALSGMFPDTIEPIRGAFDGLLPRENIRVWYAPGPVQEQQEGNDNRRQVAELIREAFLASLEPDIVHISSLFEGYVDDAVTSIGRFDNSTPVSVAFYDLIPLLGPDHYLKKNPPFRRYYERRIEQLKRAALYLAISESCRQEGLAHLDVPDNCIVNISAGIESRFHVTNIDENTAAQLGQKFGLTRSFILYTGGCDQRKNLPRLIEAFAALPAALRTGHQLVLAGKMPEAAIAELKRQANTANLEPDEVRFTGYVTDEELVHLYNLCKLFVFPSWHEGFGLPALEAMACGAPVIGAATSSIPEVIGLDEALFDPFDVAAISEKMAQALREEEFRIRACEHGLQQASKFSWDETAQRAIAAWETASRTQCGEPKSWQEMRQRCDVIYQKLVQRIASTLARSHVTSDADLRRISVCFERNEQEVDRYFRPTVLPQQINWRVEGPFDSSYSLALVNREIARALTALGHRVALHSTEGLGDFSPNKCFLAVNPDLAEMHRRASELAHTEADVASRNLYPPRVEDMTSCFKFMHAYGWEESGFPLDWVESFNFVLQGMTVMSKHVFKVMIDHGVTIPIAVSGLGVDHWQRIEPDEDFSLNAKAFRFLHVSSCFPRKGVDVLLSAYGKGFTDDDDVSLVIKTFKNPHNQIYRWLADARSRFTNYPHVLIIEDDFPDNKLKSLVEQCHVLVAPSRAEGFGLPQAEAMLSGLAVITTAWGGQEEFCYDETAWLVDYKFDLASSHFNLNDSVWAEPDESSLVKRMIEVFNMTPKNRKRKIDTGRELLLSKFRWRDVADRMVQCARSWAAKGSRNEPSIGWITSWNTRCGIAAYSKHLISAIPDNVSIFASRTDDLIGEDGKNVDRCWEADERQFLELGKKISDREVDTIVLQFNYGFFDLQSLNEFLIDQISEGRIVVIVMHSTSDPTHLPYKKLSIISHALARCHRVLVHSVSDMNRLKDLGIVKNVSLFPHGIIDQERKRRSRTASSKFNIAAYGFFLPDKGLLELIDAMALLRNRRISAHLSMTNAEYPVPASKDLIRKAVDRIHELSLENRVSICTEFLSDEECLSRLSNADLVVFPYQKTSESSSAAVRYGLASGVPVAVTPLPIFDDVRSAVHYLPGCEVEDIADGIEGLIKSIEKQEELVVEKQQYLKRWRSEHTYSCLGKRFYRMLVALRNEEGIAECASEGSADHRKAIELKDSDDSSSETLANAAKRLGVES